MEDLLYRANLAEQAERYDDVLALIKAAIILSPEVTIELRNLLSISYQCTFGAQRCACRMLKSSENKEEQKGNLKASALARMYREKLEAELKEACSEAIKFNEEVIYPKCFSADSKVNFLCYKANHYRYIAESQTADRAEHDNSVIDGMIRCYTEGSKIAAEELAPSSSARLNVALNYSIAAYEFSRDCELAYSLASQAIDLAVLDLDNLSADERKDATDIIGLMRENLALWIVELEQAQDLSDYVASTPTPFTIAQTSSVLLLDLEQACAYI